jgi:hypothetical protein
MGKYSYNKEERHLQFCGSLIKYMKMKNAKAVLSVKFKSNYGEQELIQRFENDLELFHDVPGLIEKYYIKEEETDVNGAIYIFGSKAAKTAFLNSELAKSIPVRYSVILDSLHVEHLDVTIDLKEAVAI